MSSFYCETFQLRLQLQISRRYELESDSEEKRFRVFVVDLDKAKKYPLNYVCMLPLRIESRNGGGSNFVKIFGDRSLALAKQLLSDALKEESDSDYKREFECRLNMLEPKAPSFVACASCGKLFQAEQRKRFKQKFCQDCMGKKFAARR